MEITMEGKWAYRRNPTKQVRILCVDGVGKYPVISVDEGGIPLRHQSEGLYRPGYAGGWDLVPLEEPPYEVWCLITCSNLHMFYKDKTDADRSQRLLGGKVILMKEVRE